MVSNPVPSWLRERRQNLALLVFLSKGMNASCLGETTF